MNKPSRALLCAVLSAIVIAAIGIASAEERVIDGGTWDKARPAAAGFEKRPDVPIRGRRETQDVYVLPM